MWQRQISTLFEFTSKIRLLCLRYPYDTVRDGKKNIGHDEKKKKRSDASCGSIYQSTVL
jgi:hypothetical protein